ncbi:MAG TPA: ABC transporter substrate-binding protein [Stellaceae bacterium]|nr:ABC transporter substrate-binding protein [Stellaceae bacterium]
MSSSCGRRHVVFASVAVLLALAQLGAASAAGATEKIVLQLHRPAQFEFAGYYAALWQGFYRDAGLDVTIRPGPAKPEALDPVRELAEGRAQFGTGTVQLVVRAAQGMPLRLLAPIFQDSGAEVYYRADASYPSPAALLGARIGRPPPSSGLAAELLTALRAEGADPAKQHYELVEGSDVVASLADGKADAAIGSAWDVPWQARERGVRLKSFNPADYRVEFYGDTLFTLRQTEAADPAEVQRFRDASLKGWEYAFRHSDEIANRIAAAFSSGAPAASPLGLASYQADLARRLARYPEIPLGHSNSDRWRRIQASLVATGIMHHVASIDDLVYDADADEPAGSQNTAAVATASVAAAMLLAAALLWWRRWRIPRQAEEEAGPEDIFETEAEAPPEGNGIFHRAPRMPARAEAPAAADLNTVLGGLREALPRRLARPVALRLSLAPALWRVAPEPRAIAGISLDLAAAAAADLPTPVDLIVGTRNVSLDGERAEELTAPAGDYVRITVRDNGAGIPDAAVEHLFDPATTPRPALVAAARAVARLGGFIRVETAEGIGTAVHLFFPRTDDGDARAEAAD